MAGDDLGGRQAMAVFPRVSHWPTDLLPRVPDALAGIVPNLRRIACQYNTGNLSGSRQPIPDSVACGGRDESLAAPSEDASTWDGPAVEDMRRPYRHVESMWDTLTQEGVDIHDHTGEVVPEGGVYGLKVLACQPTPRRRP